MAGERHDMTDAERRIGQQALPRGRSVGAGTLPRSCQVHSGSPLRPRPSFGQRDPAPSLKPDWLLPTSKRRGT